MEFADDKVKIAFMAAGITFFFGLVTLGIKEVLERSRERQKKEDELRSLIDLYLTEIVVGIERCNQYVRQAVMGHFSRSKLSLLVGPGKIDHCAALGAPPDCLKSLHDVYRLFDLVQNQVEKKDQEEFGAIYAFVFGEMNSIGVAVPRLIDFARTLHGKRRRIGKRLLAKAMNALWRAQKDFLIGVPEQRPLGLSRHDIDDLEKRFDRAMADTGQWLMAGNIWTHVFNALPGKAAEPWIDIATKERPKVRAKILRALSEYVRRTGTKDGASVMVLPNPGWYMLLQTGWKIAGLQIPPRPSTGYDYVMVLEEWAGFWREHDPQAWDV